MAYLNRPVYDLDHPKVKPHEASQRIINRLQARYVTACSLHDLQRKRDLHQAIEFVVSNAPSRTGPKRGNLHPSVKYRKHNW